MEVNHCRHGAPWWGFRLAGILFPFLGSSSATDCYTQAYNAASTLARFASQTFISTTLAK